MKDNKASDNEVKDGDCETGKASRNGRRASLLRRTSTHSRRSTGRSSMIADDKSVKKYLRQQSSQLLDVVDPDKKQDVFCVDEERIQQAVNDAADYSYGIEGVEVWVLEEGELHRQAKWWSESAANFFTSSSPEYVECVMVGVDLPGVLFSQSSSHQEAGGMRSSMATTPDLMSSISLGQNSSNRHPTRLSTNIMMRKTDNSRIFRNIVSLLVDPDTPKTSNLSLLVEAGFTKAAGVPFCSGGHEGVVIFYSKPDYLEEMLVSIPNLVYLQRATDVIGALVARTDVRRVTHASKLSSGVNGEGRGEDDEIQKADSEAFESKLTMGLKAWVHKCIGGGGSSQIPPAGSWNQAAWTFFGAFGGMILVSFFNYSITRATDGSYFLIMGSFGALMTLQYGLTAAPASQPRNIIFGQILSGLVAMLTTYIPSDVLPIWVRQALAIALVISMMVKLGVVHPPAGGAAVVLASGKFGWVSYGLMIAASIISLIPAIAINNLSSKRQYPIYWGHMFRRSKGTPLKGTPK